jgi:hypothetical protein
MSAQKINVSVEIGTDDHYCHKCRWLEQCPPGCRLFHVFLKLCLGGGPLRCPECEAAEKATKEKK